MSQEHCTGFFLWFENISDSLGPRSFRLVVCGNCKVFVYFGIYYLVCRLLLRIVPVAHVWFSKYEIPNQGYIIGFSIVTLGGSNVTEGHEY